MKILIVSTFDILGGAARAAYRLHRALIENGVDSRMLVMKKQGDDYTVIGPETKFRKGLSVLYPSLDQLPLKLYKNKSKTLFSPAWVGFPGILRQIEEMDPDIVHLHWTFGGMLNIEDLAKIKRPIVWSLHDMWAFTGGCHYDENCRGFIRSCGHCKVLASERERDLSRKIWRRKELHYKRIEDLTVIGLSRWLFDASRESSLLKNKAHIRLPNPLDTGDFKPLDKQTARRLWRLPEEKSLVLFGAVNATGDTRKGFKELSEALRKVKTNNVELVVFGSSRPRNEPEFGFKTHYLGHLHDDVSLATLYSAVDVMVVPSLQENLSNAIMESLSCATPVAAFDVGGNSDMIDHRVNGYLARPFDTTDLANGIDWILNLNEDQYQQLCLKAREKVLREFDSNVVARKYIELYKEVISRSGH